MDVEKEMICAEIINLSRQEKINIMTIIKNHDQNLIKRFPDGSRIDLDLLPDTVILTIYARIQYALKLDN